MSEQVTPSPLERRSFISRLSAGVAAFAGVVAGGAATGLTRSASAATFQPELHEKAKTKITEFVSRLGHTVVGIEPSPVAGTDGNQEFFACLQKKSD